MGELVKNAFVLSAEYFDVSERTFDEAADGPSDDERLVRGVADSG